MPLIMLEIDEAKIREMQLYPAVNHCGEEVYFIKEDKIVGRGRAVTMRDGFDISVEPDAETVAALFADDFTIPIFGEVFNLRYSRYDGGPLTGFADEPEDRHKGTVVVSRHYFDLGIAAKSFSHVEGYGAKFKAQP